MAITRLTLANIVDLIRLNIGEDDEGLSKITDADPGSGDSITGLYTVVNAYIQSIPTRCAAILQQEGIPVREGRLYFDMWRTSGTALTATSGSSTVHFPADYDQWISFYDETHKRTIHPVTHTSRWALSRLKSKPAGPPQRIQIEGYVTNSSAWVRKGILYPATLSGVTPNITLEYWRLPTAMAESDATTEYPDIDPKFQDLCWIGPVVQLTRPDEGSYERHREEERALLLALARSGRSI